MTANRRDHFERMRGEEAPKGETPEGAPVISQDLIDYLEAQYSHVRVSWDNATPPQEIAAHVHKAAGGREVIDHLKALFAGQQGTRS